MVEGPVGHTWADQGRGTVDQEERTLQAWCRSFELVHWEVHYKQAPNIH